MTPINSISRRLRGAALVAALGMASANAATNLDPIYFMSPDEKKVYEERERQEELRKERQKEFHAKIRRAAAGDREAIIELRGLLLIALLEPSSGTTDQGLAILRILLQELARLEDCSR